MSEGLTELLSRRLLFVTGKGGTGKVETKELKGEGGQTEGTQVKVWIPVEPF